MTETFGLDRRIENYQGARPIGLYRWDFEVLLEVIEMALKNLKIYKNKNDHGYLALKALYDRMSEENKKFYKDKIKQAINFENPDQLVIYKDLQ